ncbi:glycogen debranching protein [Paenibacillus rhizovicinus]|uniref:Glycogen debranching protein n=1 Tax=Paenibacillus rhizovicinus TaxID=2704463 RepID=A0A6C0PB25_9BACL|nr:glycogen debranching protein [Paenibacillus rhizovicinus]QHW33772.1 glycogen debranching protein [Paenibacillus rhizovicinus]
MLQTIPDNKFDLHLGPVLDPYHEMRATRGLSWQDLYICAGNRTYMVGSQNGGFPDFGHHVKLEMGGLWLHPIKLLDGFWLHIGDREAGAASNGSTAMWLTESDSFHNYPFYNEHRYRLEPLELEVVRRQFCPDDAEGIIVTYILRDLSGRSRSLDLNMLARTDLSPVWFSEGKDIVDGMDEGRIDKEAGLFLAKDERNPWHFVLGADRKSSRGKVGREMFGPHWTSGKGISGSLVYEKVSIPAGGSETIHFYMAGSNRSEQDALQTFANLRDNREQLWEAKRCRYEEIAKRTVLDIPDKHVQKVFDWVKFHNDWFVREVPDVGRGMGAGHPEYPWWFGCDNSYTLLGLLSVGGLEMAQETLSLILKASEEANGNGRIIHELSTSGLVANPGNTQETAHFIQCAWEVFKWTGDIDFLKRMYPAVKKGLSWLLEDMDPDGDLLPEGYGIIEIEGLNVELIDSAVYTWSALLAGANMAELFGEEEARANYGQLATRLGDKINRDLWIDKEGLYADAMAPAGKIASRIDIYIERAQNFGALDAVRDLEAIKAELSGLDPASERPWLFKNWVINTPMETGLAPREQAVRALDRMATDEFTGPWGTYLSGMYRDQMMTISTGVQAVAEARYDRMNESLRMIRLIASTFNKRLPGSISEMSPDYGCFVQAWTNYGMTWPLMTFMFGIKPDAYRQSLTLRPRFPDDWNDMSAKQVQLGLGERANTLDIEVSRSGDGDVYRFELQQPGWSVNVELPQPADDAFVVTLDGEPVTTAVREGSIAVAIANAGKHELRVSRTG